MIFDLKLWYGLFRWSPSIKSDFISDRKDWIVDFLDNGVSLIVRSKVGVEDNEKTCHVLRKLTRKYSFANPKFWKNQRMGFSNWNVPEKIFCFERGRNYVFFNRGLLDEIKSDFISEGFSVNVTDNTIDQNDVEMVFDCSLRDYQKVAVDALMEHSCGTIKAKPGCGKTVMMFEVIARLQRRALVVVHSNVLFNQWVREVQRFFGFTPGRYSGSQISDLDMPIVIAMQQKVKNAVKKRGFRDFISKFDILVGDEIHHWAASTFQDVANAIPAKYRYGVSATTKRKDGLEFLIDSTIGPVRHKVPKTVLMETKAIVPIKLKMVKTDFVDYDYMESKADEDKLPDYVGMLTRMHRNLDRNKLILKTVLNEIKDHKLKRVLFLCPRVEACHFWVERFRRHKIATGLMIGGADQRIEAQRTVSELKTGDIQIAVATKIADEGFDIPAIDLVVITEPVHTDLERFEQMVGRAARKSKGKKFGRAIYFWDCEMWNSTKFVSRFASYVDSVSVVG